MGQVTNAEKSYFNFITYKMRRYTDSIIFEVIDLTQNSPYWWVGSVPIHLVIPKITLDYPITWAKVCFTILSH